MPDDIGYSPEQLEDYAKLYGGPSGLMEAVGRARSGEVGADPKLVSLTPEQRASLDRYANFALLREQSGNPLTAAANYVGGVGLMAATEATKLIPGAQRAASAAWNAVTGQPQSNTQFFGGQDTSKPSLQNITSAHYGFTRGQGQPQGQGQGQSGQPQPTATTAAPTSQPQPAPPPTTPPTFAGEGEPQQLQQVASQVLTRINNGPAEPQLTGYLSRVLSFVPGATTIFAGILGQPTGAVGASTGTALSAGTMS